MVKVTLLRLKVAGPKFHAHAHQHLMDSAHTQTGHTGIDTIGTGVSKVKLAKLAFHTLAQEHQDSMLRLNLKQCYFSDESG